MLNSEVIMIQVSVIGDGGWGTALSLILHSKGISTTLWSVSAEYAEYLRKKRENTKFLKGISLPENLKITSDITEVSKADYAFFSVPCRYLRQTAGLFKDARFKHIVSTTKGIENGSLKRPSEILGEYFPHDSISVLSGPSIALEVARNIPTAVVVASGNETRKNIQEFLVTEYFRIYTSRDMVGVELGGALKNIIAIAAGISDGLGFGTNTKAAILTRGMVEITRLGVKMGAEKATFSGLSGLGDLATTCISQHSRNRWFGEKIGKGETREKILSQTEMVVEGLDTVKSAYDLSKKHNVEMPITEKIYKVLYENESPREAVKELMTRGLKEED